MILLVALALDARSVQKDSQIFESIRHRSIAHLQSLEGRFPSIRAGGVALDLSGLRTHHVNPTWELYDRRYLKLHDPANLTTGFEYLDGPPDREVVTIRYPPHGEIPARVEHVENDVLPSGVFGVSLTGYAAPRGLWATTRRAFRCQLWVSSGRPLTRAEIQLLRDETSMWITGNSQVEIDAWKETLLGREPFVYIASPAGYLHNTFTLSLLATLLYTLASTPFALRRALRAGAHACPHCAYDLAGIDADRCPECGALRST